MPVRTVWRPPWYAWTLVGLAALALIHKSSPHRLEGRWLVVVPVLIILIVLVLRKLWELPPYVSMCGAILLTVFSGGWRLMGLGGLPFDRLLLVVVLLACFLRAPGIARMPRLTLRPIHLLLCLTVLYALTSALAAGTLSSESDLQSLTDQFGVTPYLIFLIAPAMFAGARERNLLLTILVGLGAYLGTTAIFESLGPHSLVFPSYIVHVDQVLPEGRAGGPFQSPVADGFATFACAVAAAIAFGRWRTRRQRWFAALVAVDCLFGCFLTLERGVWVAALAATVITALFTRTGRRWLLPGIAVCALTTGAMLAVSPTLREKISGRLTHQTSVWDRQNQTAAGLRMVAAKPLFGFGWARFTTDDLPYFRQASTYPLTGITNHEQPLPLHDTYLGYAVELGLVGVLLWLASMLWGVGGAIFARGSADLRAWKLGLLAISIFFLVVALFDPQPAPFTALLLWTWAGVALGSESLCAQTRRAPPAVLERTATSRFYPPGTAPLGASLR